LAARQHLNFISLPVNWENSFRLMPSGDQSAGWLNVTPSHSFQQAKEMPVADSIRENSCHSCYAPSRS
jgi:hypothetical protein